MSRAWKFPITFYGYPKWLIQQHSRTSIARNASTRVRAVLDGSRQGYRPNAAVKKVSPFSMESETEARVKTIRRQTLFVGGGLFVFFGSMYATLTYVQGEPEMPSILPGEDVSHRYEHIAADFDKYVSSTEWWMGIGRLRKKLFKQVSGDVLEVSVGTGRNSAYYKEDQCKSITMLDQSREMIDIARTAFKGTHPKYSARKFVVQSALNPIASPPGGFDTIVQTMGLCSTPDPVGLLKQMESVLKPNTGRILLLEHGRSYYDWVNERLDYYAPHHAHKFGCWWNKDIDKIVNESGLEVVNLKRHHFGTTWWVELKSKASA